MLRLVGCQEEVVALWCRWSAPCGAIAAGLDPHEDRLELLGVSQSGGDGVDVPLVGVQCDPKPIRPLGQGDDGDLAHGVEADDGAVSPARVARASTPAIRASRC